MSKIGWVDTYWAIIVPSFASPMGLFLMKQVYGGCTRCSYRGS